jgi:hypothetical protein
VHLVISLHPDHSSDVSIHQLAEKVGIPCQRPDSDGEQASSHWYQTRHTLFSPFRNEQGMNIPVNSLITATSEVDRRVEMSFTVTTLNFGIPARGISHFHPTNTWMMKSWSCFTSGTTGKKLVPPLVGRCAGWRPSQASVSWNLTERHELQSHAPLHVGGNH